MLISDKMFLSSGFGLGMSSGSMLVASFWELSYISLLSKVLAFLLSLDFHLR